MRRFLNTRTGQFLVFLLAPEDSSDDGFLRKTSLQARFDTPVGGAVKIIFWIIVMMAFWIMLPLLCR
jgi:hypothetical protein